MFFSNSCWTQIGHMLDTKHWDSLKFLRVKYRWSRFTFIFTILITPWWLLFGSISRKIILTHPKTNSNICSCQTRLELQMGLASMVRWNKTNLFLAVNTQDGFGEHRDKKYPHVYYEIYCRMFDVSGPIFLLGVLNILFRHMAPCILSNINR